MFGLLRTPEVEGRVFAGFTYTNEAYYNLDVNNGSDLAACHLEANPKNEAEIIFHRHRTIPRFQTSITTGNAVPALQALRCP